MNWQVSGISIYPIKSTSALNLESSEVTAQGLLGDRKWLLLNEANEVMTGREYPLMLKIISAVENGALHLQFGQESKVIDQEEKNASFDFKLWKQPVKGITQNSEVSSWLSDKLGVNCKLIYQADFERQIPEKEGAIAEGTVSFADQAPILLLSEESVEDLNNRLEHPVSTGHFRPNIVVKGGVPYGEEAWKYIRIGECEFEVLEGCKRCVFITIDPESLEKDKNQEPLRTLAKYKRHPRGSVSFGVHLVPRKQGKISIDNQIEVIR